MRAGSPALNSNHGNPNSILVLKIVFPDRDLKIASSKKLLEKLFFMTVPIMLKKPKQKLRLGS
jgi:hypothetical protein